MSHRVTLEWMGESVETLDDLLRPGLCAACVGINPTPTSVAAGHYYQGRLGQQFYRRLRRAGLLLDEAGWEDDLAFEHGVGFTDIVKRPTTREADIEPAEFAYGRERLIAKLEAAAPELIIFSFKKTAVVLFGKFVGNGFMEGLEVAGARVFVMPGPYESSATVAKTLAALSAQCRDRPQMSAESRSGCNS